MLCTQPIDAATVILTRDSSQESYKLLLVRRGNDQKFMGGAYVFPGGRLDEADCDPDLISYVDGLTPQMAQHLLQEPDLPLQKALGLFVTALRETFEEAGVLLARDASGRLLDLSDAETATRFASYRLNLFAGELSLKEIAEKERIRYAIDLLIPYARWITPEIESTRFDARFFLARHPRAQFPFHDSIETTKSLWLSPSQALAMHDAGDVLLMPPTLKTIHELSTFISVEDLFTAAATRTIYPVLPQAFADSDPMILSTPFRNTNSRRARMNPPVSS